MPATTGTLQAAEASEAKEGTKEGEEEGEEDGTAWDAREANEGTGARRSSEA